MDRRTAIAVAAFVFLVAATAGGVWIGQRTGLLAGATGADAITAQRHTPTTAPAAALAAAALIGGPFSLTDQDGKAVTDADLRGHWSLVFFGYTHCADVCPLTLQRVTDTLDDLGAQANTVVPYFITVDPERDTQAVMREYARHFHARLRALTGTPVEVKATADAYRVYYARQTAAPGGDYEMDHTAIVYVLGPDAKYVAHFIPEAGAADMTAKLKSLLRSQG